MGFGVVTIPGAASGILKIGLIDIKDLRMFAAYGHNKFFCPNASGVHNEKHQLCSSSTQSHQGLPFPMLHPRLLSDGSKVAASVVDAIAVPEGIIQTKFSLALSLGTQKTHLRSFLSEFLLTNYLLDHWVIPEPVLGKERHSS